MKHNAIRIFLCFVMAIVFLASCVDSAARDESVDAGGMGEMSVGTLSSEGEDVAEGTFFPSSCTEVSDKNATVYYAGEDFAKSVFAVGGEMLYACGRKEDGSFFLGSMQKEEDVFQEFDAGMEEGLRAFDMVVDSRGQCHILWMSVEKVEINGQLLDRIDYGKSFITVVNGSREVEKELDISDVLSSRRTRPFCFAVDREGNYYIESGKELIQITSDGIQGKTVSCAGWIEGVGVGKSGAVYCTYAEEGDGQGFLARLDGDGFVVCDVRLPEAQAVYAGIYAGTDSELLLFNKSSGIFAYDDDEIEVK